MIKTEQLRAFLPFSPDLATCCLAGPLPFYTPTPRLNVKVDYLIICQAAPLLYPAFMFNRCTI